MDLIDIRIQKKIYSFRLSIKMADIGPKLIKFGAKENFLM